MRASDLLADGGPRSADPVVLPWRAEGRSSAAGADEGAPVRGSERRADTAPRLRAVVAFTETVAEAPESAAEQRERGEAALLKKLRGKGLSVSEARAHLRGTDVDREVVDEIVEHFASLGYLDDAVLAEQLVYQSISRKNQGRRAIAQTLQARGIDRETVEAALADLPDDDADRALDFARSKAPAMAKLDPDVALRRLVGQLGRRGFPGNVAMTAAKTALGENPRSGVRFR